MPPPFEPDRSHAMTTRGKEADVHRGVDRELPRRQRWVPPKVDGSSHGRTEKSLASCERVFFLHMRKAAGTSIRALLDEVSRRTGLEIDVQEGWALDPQRVEEPKTFTVTCLREPIDRLCSLYNYEGRWPSRDQPQTPDTAVPFETWIHKRPRPRNPKLWDESADYYTKTLSGGPFDQRGIGTDSVRYARACQTLDRFDLVLIREGFGTPQYDAWWSQRLGLGSTATMPVRRKTKADQSLYDVRDHLTEELRRHLVALNSFDVRLYRRGCRRLPVALPQFAKDER